MVHNFRELCDYALLPLLTFCFAVLSMQVRICRTAAAGIRCLECDASADHQQCSQEPEVEHWTAVLILQELHLHSGM
jgi:hypothetical protein